MKNRKLSPIFSFFLCLCDMIRFCTRKGVENLRMWKYRGSKLASCRDRNLESEDGPRQRAKITVFQQHRCPLHIWQLMVCNQHWDSSTWISCRFHSGVSFHGSWRKWLLKPALYKLAWQSQMSLALIQMLHGCEWWQWWNCWQMSQPMLKRVVRSSWQHWICSFSWEHRPGSLLAWTCPCHSCGQTWRHWQWLYWTSGFKFKGDSLTWRSKRIERILSRPSRSLSLILCPSFSCWDPSVLAAIPDGSRISQPWQAILICKIEVGLECHSQCCWHRTGTDRYWKN